MILKFKVTLALVIFKRADAQICYYKPKLAISRFRFRLH
jgi:hypothetical protein